MRTINRDIVSALLISKDNKLWQGIKKEGGVYPDCWQIPGGGIEEGEDKVSALIREIKEEVGLDLSPDQIVLRDDKGEGESEKTLRDTREKVIAKMKFYVYEVMLDKPASDIQITLGDDEYAHYEWCDLGKLKDLKLAPPSVSLFKRLGYL